MPVFPPHSDALPAQMALNLHELLPLRSLIITLRFTESASPGFFHQPAMTAFIRFLLGSPEHYEKLLVLDMPESARVRYRAGDMYRFQLVALDGAEPLLDSLFEKLPQLPASAAKTGNGEVFCDNLQLVDIQDAFTLESVQGLEQCSCYSNHQLTEEALLWQDSPHFSWHWLSPARISLPKTARQAVKKRKGGRDQEFVRDLPQLSGGLLLQRLYDAVANLLRERGQATAPRPESPALTIADGQLFWLEVGYKGESEKESLMGGVHGQLQLHSPQPLDLSWWRLLILGQYLGLGQRRVFGWGRYQLVTPQQQVSYRRASPAHSQLHSVACPQNLLDALNHVQRNSRSSGDQPDTTQPLSTTQQQQAWDNNPDSDSSDAQLQRLQYRLQQIEQGQYETPLLTGWLIRKNSGGYRPLAVPPFQDRVIQRAVAQALSPALERLMYNGSFGYRPGRSRINAMEQIRRAVRDGYCWVFESDLRDFFDSVDLNHLAVRLRSLYGDDPLIDQILHWMAADVQFQGDILQRHCGLPQGSPLSPLLANLMLDDFDNDMDAAGFRLIRFADDFVVMCRSPEEARAAEERARASLQEHGLALNNDKTHIKPMDAGLRYLGYLFVNDLVLDTGGEKKPHDSTKPVPENSWLAQLSGHKLRQLSPDASDQQIRIAASPQPQQAQSVGQRDSSGTVVCVSGGVCVLSTSQGRLQIRREDEQLLDTPWRSLQAVLLLGNHHITTPALRTAMKQGVAVHMADGMGRYQGTCWSGQSKLGHQVWLRQQQCFSDEAQTLAAAKALVTARIEQCAQLLKNRQLDGSRELRALKNELQRADSLQRLNGYEGAAAARYFKALARYLPESFAFESRNRRPPQDPFNVLLSLGYTLLYGYTDSLLRVAGLLPTVGFYHQPHGRHAGLASDLMEPFRHWVERQALMMVRQKQLRLEDFEFTATGCQMHPDALRRYLAALTESFETPRKLTCHPEPLRLTDMLQQQNRALLRWINEGETFTPWQQG